MSGALTELEGTLTRLHGGGASCGLTEAAARGFVGDLERGTPLADAAKRAGLDPRLTSAVVGAGVSDSPALIARLAPCGRRASA